MSPTARRVLTLTLALLLIAGPTLAYTIFLKDGSTLDAKEEYRVEGDRAIITLPNGTVTFLALDEIDVEKTALFNQQNLGGAMLLEGGEIRALPSERPLPKQTLGDLIASGEAKPRVRREARREENREIQGPRKTQAGHLDLNTLRRQAYNDLEFMGELRSYFTSKGLEAQIFRGSQGDRPMIQVITSSESSVFKSLQVTAQAMAQMRERHPSRMATVELLLHTSRGTPAGQFLLTKELAAEINSPGVDVARIFVDHVQF